MTKSKKYSGSDQADELPQAVALALMRKTVTLVENTNIDEISMIVVPVQQALQHGLPEVLFTAVAPTREERAKVYGPRNEAIDIRFGNLTRALSNLAEGSGCDREALRDGETVLKDLLRGALKERLAVQRGVNPEIAAGDASLTRALRALGEGVMASRTPVSPNEIDAMQNDALSSYQTIYHAAQVLGLMLSAVTKINRHLGGPGVSAIGRSS